MAISRTPARAKDFLHKTEPDHDLLNLGFTFENGVLQPRGNSRSMQHGGGASR
jgi:hypothetical protein